MKTTAILAAVTLASSVAAQKVVAFSEPKTGIKFASFARGAFNWGISLPKEPNGDFIGHLAGSKAMGWVGGDLGPMMVGPLLIVAWPNGQTVQGSIRKADKPASPPVYTGNATLIPIEKGTYISDNGFSYTFLCKGCLSDTATSFSQSAASAKLGFAAASAPPTNPADAATALSYHNVGQGAFTVNLAAAKSDQYATWAALAAAPAAVAAAPAAPAAAAPPAAAAAPAAA